MFGAGATRRPDLRKRRGLIFLFGLVLAFSFQPPPAAAAETPPEVRIGILAFRGAAQARDDWSPTIGQLSAALKRYRVVIVTGTAAELTQKLAARRLDFVITNPGHAFELQNDLGAVQVAASQNIDGTPPAASTGAAIFVDSNRTDLDHLSDLQGQRLAAAARDTFSFRLAWHELVNDGIDPFADMHPDFVGFPAEAVIAAVRSGRADAGVVRSCLLEQLVDEGTLPPGTVKILDGRSTGVSDCRSSTRLYPSWPILKGADVPDSLAREVSEALLSLQPGSGNVAWSTPVSLRPVQEVYRALRIGPYEELRGRGLGGLLWEYRYWVALLALAFLWTIAHVLRVEYLIRRRTGELQRLHEERRAREEKMEHVVRLSLVGEMASSLAHEINQPLAAIVNYARGCIRRIESGSSLADIAEGVGQIATQADRAAAIVRHMRDFVRKRPVRHEPLDPIWAIEDALELFQPSAASAGLTVRFLPKRSIGQVRADKLQLEEVVLNLLQNAAEAVRGQDERLATVSITAEGHDLHVQVLDNGPGMPPEVTERLFEAFFTTKTDGLGLGLSLSRTIVEAHGGRLWAESRPEGGCAMHFTLPLAEEGGDD